MSLESWKRQIKQTQRNTKRRLELNITADLLKELHDYIQTVGQDWVEMHNKILDIALQILRDWFSVLGSSQNPYIE